MNKLFSTLRYGFFAMITLGFLALTPSAQAVTLNVVGGQLLGASGVDVDGTLYNVEFRDGSCVFLFEGCNEVSDFTFQTQATAELAAQALLALVLIDGPDGQFDSEPDLLNGIMDPDAAFILIPYSLNGTTIDAAFALNVSPVSTAGDGFGSTVGVRPAIRESFGDFEIVFALFTAAPLSVVPLPPAGVLFGSGLVFLALLRRRAKKPVHA